MLWTGVVLYVKCGVALLLINKHDSGLADFVTEISRGSFV